MKTQFYFPAPVEVVKVTNENLAEVATWCGGEVASTESRRVPGRMDSYVWVPTPKGSSISWAFPGMFITKRLVVTVKDEMKATYAIFRRDYFSRNFFDTPTMAVDKTWEKQEKNKGKDSIVATSPAPKKPKPAAPFKSKQEIDAETIKTKQGFNLMRVAEAIRDNPIDTIINPKENDMEQSPHGYPILTEAEAAELKAGQETPDEITMEQAIENVKEVFPGAVEIDEENDLTGDDIAAGEILEPETDTTFAPALTDGSEEYATKADHEAKSEWLG